MHTDHLGSTRLVTDSSKNIVAAATYHPFGDTSTVEGPERYLFTGKVKDSTDLYYYGARYYDYETGRFITRNLYTSLPNDPRIISGSTPNTTGYKNPQTFNQFSYAGNNPLKLTELTESLSWYEYDIRFNFGQQTYRMNTLKLTCCLAEESRAMRYKEVDEENADMRESRMRLSDDLRDLLRDALEAEELRELLDILASGGDGDGSHENCLYVVRDCDGYYVADFDNRAEAEGSRAAQDFWDSDCKHKVREECGEIDKTKRPVEFCLGTSLISIFLGVAVCTVFVRQKKKKVT